MDDWLSGGLIGGIAGGIAGGMAVFLMTLLAPPKKCPECGTPAPKRYKPANRRERFWGGWTCPQCGTEVDRKGRRVED